MTQAQAAQEARRQARTHGIPYVVVRRADSKPPFYTTLQRSEYDGISEWWRHVETVAPPANADNS